MPYEDPFMTSDQAEILRSIDRCMARHLPPEAVRKHDMEHSFPEGLLKAFGELGILGLPFPEDHGGLAQDWTTVSLVQERLGYHAAIAAALYSITVDFGGMTLMTAGTGAQKERLLPGLVAGDLQFALALTEPQAGTDAAALTTKATRTETGWRVSGRKIWISLADTADYLVTPCRTEPGSTGKRGITMLMIPRQSDGIAMTVIPKLGTHAMVSYEVTFDDVEVGQEALIGTEGDGFRVLMSTLQYSRAGQAANALGQAQAAIDLGRSHAIERRQFGQRLADFQVLRHRLVDMQMRVDQARLTFYDRARRISEGHPCRKESATTKVLASEALQYVTHHGMQIMASAGYAAESDMNRYWRDGRLLSFGEGANEMLRDLIAREMDL